MTQTSRFTRVRRGPFTAIMTSICCVAWSSVALSQSPAEWDAANGVLPDETTPYWTEATGNGFIPACAHGDAILGSSVLTLDSSSCPESTVSYGMIGFSSIVPSTTTTAFLETETRVVSTLAASPDAGPAQLAVLVAFHCPVVLHIDVGEIVLEYLAAGPGVPPIAGRVSLDTTSQFRTYRLEVDDATGLVRVLVDGQLMLSPMTPLGTCISATGESAQIFGNMSDAEGGVVEWRRASSNLVPNVQHQCFFSAQPNSTGTSARLGYSGSLDAAVNDFTLSAHRLPPGSFGFFLCSRQFASPMQLAMSQGELCLGGPVGRLIAPGQVVTVPAPGFLQLDIDLSALPQPTGSVAVMPGDWWCFQFWYRDNNPNPTSNVSSAIGVRFR